MRRLQHARVRIHIGPYLRSTLRHKSVEKTIVGCFNATCTAFNRHDDSRFCNACGGKIVEHPMPVSVWEPTRGVIEDVFAANDARLEKLRDTRLDRDEEAEKPDVMIHVPCPSRTPEHPRRFSTYKGEVGEAYRQPHPIAPGPKWMEDEIAWFNDHFASEVRAMRIAIPEPGSVEVAWGVVVWDDSLR